jgi:glutathione-independent formaldehyde dehydrogenase
VSVEEVPDPRPEAPGDAVVRITTTNICGSDLHMYEERTSVEEGKVLGHENMGIVEATGPGVTRIEPGDRVSVPFNIACGSCRNCVDGLTAFCLRTNPTEGVDGAAYGYANMGPYSGGQAESLRVPHADFNLLELPAGTEHENDFTMLSDIFPTGWHGTELAGMRPGDTAAVCWTSWSRPSGRRPASVWSASTSPRTRRPPPRAQRTAGSASTTAPSSPRASGWAPASAR